MIPDLYRIFDGLDAGSLDRLATLPVETVVYSGHGPSTTIGEEAGWMRSIRSLG